MSSGFGELKIDGLREMQAALKAIDGESQKSLRVVLNSVAQTVAQGARSRVPVKTGKARASIRATSQQRVAQVTGGKASSPYYGWLDFGGTVGKGRVSGGVKKKALHPGKIVRQWLGRPVGYGRYLYPSYFAQRGNVQKALRTEILALAKRCGFVVSSG